MQEALDGIEFARGDPNSTWGSLRAKWGHPEPFDLRYVAVGNEDCGKKNYRGLHSALFILFYFEIHICLCNKNKMQKGINSSPQLPKSREE